MAPQLAKELVSSDLSTFRYNSRGMPEEVEYNCFIDFNKRELTTVISQVSWKNPHYEKKTILLSSEQISILR